LEAATFCLPGPFLFGGTFNASRNGFADVARCRLTSMPTIKELRGNSNFLDDRPSADKKITWKAGLRRFRLMFGTTSTLAIRFRWQASPAPDQAAGVPFVQEAKTLIETYTVAKLYNLHARYGVFFAF